MKVIIEATLSYLVDNAESLSKSKFSGVHHTTLGYRIHASSFLPLALTASRDSYKIVSEVVNTSDMDAEWDAQSLWLTINPVK